MASSAAFTTIISAESRIFSQKSTAPMSSVAPVPKFFLALWKPLHSSLPRSISNVQENPYEVCSFPCILPPSHDFPSIFRTRILHFPIFSSTKTTISLSPKLPIPKSLQNPSVSPPLTPVAAHDPHSEFQEKMLFLDSLGINFFSLINKYPPIITSSLADIKSTVAFMTSLHFTAIEFQRIVGMCPEILTSHVSDLLPVITFLLREAKVNSADLKQVINRRPRLLACGVKTQLRPTMYFLQSIGISEVNKHTSLLSCSVEEKLIPRIEYFENLGFCHRDALIMFRRFPPLFCYSIKENFEPKFNYFVVEMGRDLKELKEFPQYFSFSLENRIKPRHQCCVEKGVYFSLPVLLKTSKMEFQERLEVCCNSSLPFRSSPLWCIDSDINAKEKYVDGCC